MHGSVLEPFVTVCSNFVLAILGHIANQLSGLSTFQCVLLIVNIFNMLVIFALIVSSVVNHHGVSTVGYIAMEGISLVQQNR